ncbi:MAG: hypothetical protein LBM93_15525, partial [Oscillospiraceae bacterium]|nr:hypothetical protein [Oscillospiraceae bacterium]
EFLKPFIGEQINCFNKLQQPRRYPEVFLDERHLSPQGNELWAEGIFDYLFESKYFEDSNNLVNIRPNAEEKKNPDLQNYITEISKYAPKQPVFGSIVMNCNPFTLGHRYLIEYASSRVDKLFIFVVEEDKSVFPFADRLELVRKGTADLQNVVVLPSGKFIISANTFAAYFTKSEQQDIVIDASNDLSIFGEQIAPTLGITVRFAGEEPTDNITRQYNSQMSIILPKYNIRFEEIPRKEFNGVAISASRVRKLLETKDFHSIAEIVPATTLNYLKEKFS